MVAHGANLRADAQEYMTRYLEILLPYDLSRALKFALPGADAGLVFPESIPQFDATVAWGRSG